VHQPSTPKDQRLNKDHHTARNRESRRKLAHSSVRKLLARGEDAAVWNANRHANVCWSAHQDAVHKGLSAIRKRARGRGNSRECKCDQV
jgi:hypothetical protein